MIEQLPPLQRLALAYAPAQSRAALLALLALDGRLAQIVRASHEPMLAQLRLTWWREQLSLGAGERPSGEPLLGVLAAWPAPNTALGGLVDGWEAMIGQPPLGADAFRALAEARGHAFAALAGDDVTRETSLRMGRNWALADIAGKLSDAAERAVAAKLVSEQDWRWQRLPRNLRPLAVLHGLGARAVRSGRHLGDVNPGDLLVAMRIGLAGR